MPKRSASNWPHWLASIDSSARASRTPWSPITRSPGRLLPGWATDSSHATSSRRKNEYAIARGTPRSDRTVVTRSTARFSAAIRYRNPPDTPVPIIPRTLCSSDEESRTWGIVEVFREARASRFDETRLEAELDSRGFINRFFGRFTRVIRHPWQMYPVGLLFGMGFDTATEVSLLFLAAGAAGAGLPAYAILALPVLFAAGMSLLDTLDGSFMNFAYQWAFSEPARKVFYNLVITGLSVAVALVIGTVELAGLVAHEVQARGPFWSWLENINMSALGLVIGAMFVATWLLALLVWRFGRVEERWKPRLQP
jgi:High-affinity nickel-transport protein